MSILVGTTVLLNIETDGDGTPSDPDSLVFMWREPGASAEEFSQFVYGTDSELVRDAAGQYHVYMTLGMTGLWRFRAVAVRSGAVIDAHATADVVGLPGW